MAETTMEPAVPPWTGPGAEELEQRLQRLEDVVASLCDTQVLEERVRDRVLEQLRADIEELKKQRGEKQQVDTKPDGEAAPKAEPQIAQQIAQPPVAALAGPGRQPVPPPPEPMRSLLREFSWELRTLFQMVRDPFYRLSWSARLVLLLPATYILWSMLFSFPEGIPIIGPPLRFILSFVIAYGTAYVVFKVFARELRRYREFTTRNPW